MRVDYSTVRTFALLLGTLLLLPATALAGPNDAFLDADAISYTGGPDAGRALLVVRAKHVRAPGRTRQDSFTVTVSDGFGGVAAQRMSFRMTFHVPRGRGRHEIHHRVLLDRAASRRIRNARAPRLTWSGRNAAAAAAAGGDAIDRSSAPGTFVPAAQYCSGGCNDILHTYLDGDGRPTLGSFSAGANEPTVFDWSSSGGPPLSCDATSCSVSGSVGRWRMWGGGPFSKPFGLSDLPASFSGSTATVDAGSGPPGVPGFIPGVPRGQIALSS